MGETQSLKFDDWYKSKDNLWKSINMEDTIYGDYAKAPSISDYTGKSDLVVNSGAKIDIKAPDAGKGFDFGNALGGIGSFMSGIGSVYDSIVKSKYQKKMFNLEKDRIDRQLAQQAKSKEILNNVWG